MMRFSQQALLLLFLSLAMTKLLASSVTIADAGPEQQPLPDLAQLQQEQRQHYQQTLQTIRKGLGNRAREDMASLRDYPLYPYLVKEYLQRRLRSMPYAEVDQFLSEYGETIPGQTLRRRWLQQLYRKREWQQFISYYHPEQASRSLQCSYLEALHQTGQTALAYSQTAAIWLSANSQPDECDPVFQRWQEAGLQTDEMVWRRIVMALEAGNYRLARYLGSRSQEPLHTQAKKLLWLYRKPELLLDDDNYQQATATNAELVSFGLRRLAKRDPLQATELWQQYAQVLPFTGHQTFQLRETIARQIIASGSDQALDWLLLHDPNADDSYLLEWRVRLAIGQHRWGDVKRWISLMPDELRNSPRWRYWHARALEQQADSVSESRQLFTELATQRTYYGFLAADRLSLEYGFNHSPLQQLDTEARVASLPGIARAREFYYLDMLTQARREWYQTVKHFTREELVAATSLANQWQWHHQAIMTTIKADEWDDLMIRFPLAYQSEMTKYAQQASIETSWLYAIARQESAFAEDAASSAGARGLMQLLPTTARDVASGMGIGFKTRDLYRPETNISLGSRYLQQLMTEYSGNRILATAAYNAGPERVNRWLEKQQNQIEHDVWIETLPYHETRNYIQNVLAFSVIYGYRLGQDKRLILPTESLISREQTGTEAR